MHKFQYKFTKKGRKSCFKSKILKIFYFRTPHRPSSNSWAQRTSQDGYIPSRYQNIEYNGG